MALYKQIRQNDGVVTSYHRILYLQLTTNRRNAIAVISYVDDSVRKDEKDSIIMQPYCASVTYETDYDESMTMAQAYEYLKTLPEFEGATNI